MKRNILKVTSVLLAISLLMIWGEVAIRGYNYFKHRDISLVKPAEKKLYPLVSDKYAGWLPSPNFVWNGYKVDAGGKKYPVNIHTDKNGFRTFGNTEIKNKSKVLFLGDSFTHALEVSNDKTYYGILKNSLPIEVFAFGGGGYGTLQEYLILNGWVDDIQPDLVIIQFCSNDFINNSYELELRSKRNNNGLRRPYYTQDGILFKIPKRFATVRTIANEYSQLLYFIVHRIDKIYARYANTVESIIKENPSYPLYQEAVATTDALFKRIKARMPETTIVCAFSVDSGKPFYEDFAKISEKNGINFIDGIPQALRSA